MQLQHFPAEEELESAYADAESFDYVAQECGQRATARETLRRIERFATPPGRFLDLGCWVGFLLAEAAELEWDTHGVEPSEFASGFAREHLGLRVQTAGLFDAVLDRGGYKVVYMGDVIEHLIDPVHALERVRELLEPDGIVALALPDAGSRVAGLMRAKWWSVIPTHVHYFTRASISEALHRAGLSPIMGWTAPKRFTVEYYLSRLGGYSEALASGTTRLARGLGLGNRTWAPDFRDRMLVLAAARDDHPAAKT